ncbi:Hypothetical predicted protein [Mytilus galloprovincialis]|uniref:Uncharacterized protein n=1 Tax=Mytilus galloprovincialis TaxID=29158 RepID=A0A8B6BWG1_MYTGA|nr:Hypothetical predicted protein [Mytilus galloprovincialis]
MACLIRLLSVFIIGVVVVNAMQKRCKHDEQKVAHCSKKNGGGILCCPSLFGPGTLTRLSGYDKKMVFPFTARKNYRRLSFDEVYGSNNGGGGYGGYGNSGGSSIGYGSGYGGGAVPVTVTDQEMVAVPVTATVLLIAI